MKQENSEIGKKGLTDGLDHGQVMNKVEKTDLSKFHTDFIQTLGKNITLSRTLCKVQHNFIWIKSA